MIETFLVFEQFLTKTLFPNFCGGVYIISFSFYLSMYLCIYLSMFVRGSNGRVSVRCARGAALAATRECVGGGSGAPQALRRAAQRRCVRRRKKKKKKLWARCA